MCFLMLISAVTLPIQTLHVFLGAYFRSCFTDQTRNFEKINLKENKQIIMKNMLTRNSTLRRNKKKKSVTLALVYLNEHHNVLGTN